MLAVVVTGTLLVAGCIGGSPPNLVEAPDDLDATMSLSASNWSGTTSRISILDVTSNTVDVSILTYQVTALNGTIYFTGAAGTGTPVFGVTVTVAYNDGNSDGLVGAQDNIAVSVGTTGEVTMVSGSDFRVFGTGGLLLSVVKLP